MRMVILFLLPLFAHAQWTPEQKTLAAMSMTALAVDYGQTRRIASEPQNWREYNPILGEHPSMKRVNTYFALVPLVSYLVLDNISSDHRTLALKLLAGMEIANVGRNQYLGIRVRF